MSTHLLSGRNLGRLWFGVTSVALVATSLAAQPDFQSKYQAIGLSRTVPAFSYFTVDSLGQGRLKQNPVLSPSATPAATSLRFVTRRTGRFAYLWSTPSGRNRAVWRVRCGTKTLMLRSEYLAGAPATEFGLLFNQKINHATLLGLMRPGQRRMALPCVLHMPDMGTVRITANVPGLKLDYDARRWNVPHPFVSVRFPAASAEHRRVEYRFEVTAIYPHWAGLDHDPIFNGFKRDYLNMFQVNPRVQMLANNASSDPVAFTVFEYADVARYAPPLAHGLTCLDLVRMTLDRYLAGAKGYGQVGYGKVTGGADIIGWKTPWTSLDSLPSLLSAACTYAEAAHDLKWARAHYDHLARWAHTMMAADHDGNGLIEYPGTGNYGDRPLADRRPANWWDTINFGHEDAYSNALAYHACRQFAQLARQLGHARDADFFTARADKLRAAYVPTFLDPKTGVLAGWKSADGHLHDYWFTFVQGVAITYGLVDKPTANSIMDHLLHKMSEVGYTNFAIGLPGNLVPVHKGDYVLQHSKPTQFGEPQREDGSDGFQYYENGGATGCWAYYTVNALYQLGRIQDARRLFLPMLAGYAAGNFQGFGPDGMSNDWRDWHGGGHGYEGLLVDNYLTLLAVKDELQARKRK